ncbi:RluA family pseudouridine synthase [Peptoanaerobacter stomatis]|uniref:RluA family pseudouridine synthase n=1 Tax=Peptoanaerobacter stomatis TaxID=796937 RepID=UPI003F9FE370
MYIEDRQKYNEFIYVCDNDMNLKTALLDMMKFSVRGSIGIKNGEGRLTVNGKERPKNGQLKKGDIIKIIFEDESSDYKTQYKDIKILYEDEDLLIVDKPAFMVVHPTKSHLEDTLLNYIQGIFESKNIKSKVRFVSRLDRDTSGIITVAKNSFSHYALSQGFVSDKIKKYYTAVVKNSMKDEKGTIKLKIAKADDDTRRIISQNGQDAVTHYQVLKNEKNFAIVKLLLETGRTHQIRVHLSAIGNNIIGDELYGEKSELISRQALHCSRLELVSPRNMKEIVVESKLPDDINALIEELE